MDGKKFALTIVSIVVGVSLLIVIAMLLFFKYYEPKTPEGETVELHESSLLTPEQAPIIIVLNSR
ncbi:hypothetical protein R6U77_07220 [Lysinibacillus louembei]|uniref:Uncharacterized protein n=1 Tax=Lysinibacillus louembei TaxID=1470088 RepID=A0ABZ0S2M7_9BACI|nr:hypothetical protein [Lysinibacillus louembei]WPK13460.1 hypothetical protein R6U77_07220 [Lysinibacillus louembei]